MGQFLYCDIDGIGWYGFRNDFGRFLFKSREYVRDLNLEQFKEVVYKSKDMSVLRYIWVNLLTQTYWGSRIIDDLNVKIRLLTDDIQTAQEAAYKKFEYRYKDKSFDEVCEDLFNLLNDVQNEG